MDKFKDDESCVEAYITLNKATIELLGDLKGPLEKLASYKERAEDISDMLEDVQEQQREEKVTVDDLEDADNWDELKALSKELEDLQEDLEDIQEDAGVAQGWISTYSAIFKIK